MAAQSSNQAPSLSESTIAAHRESLHQLISRLVQVRSTVVAFRLASTADSYERPEIAWDELMRTIECLLPDEERIEQVTGAILADLGRYAGAPSA